MNFHTVRGLSSRSHPLFFARSVRAVRQSALVAVSALGMLYGGQAMAQDKYIGEVFLFAGSYCPSGSAEANGALVAITSNGALFAILGTTYGGNGTTNLALPDLRGRSPIGAGQGSDLQDMKAGKWGGTESITLTQNNLPAHTHQINSTTTTVASTKPATHSTPGADRVPAQTMNAGGYIDASQADTTLRATTESTASVVGSSSSSPTQIPIRDPYLVMRWCIVTYGLYPLRP